MEINSLFSSIYRKKKVFVTGHTGFKGSWLSLWLNELEAEVKGYALQPEENSLYVNIQSDLKIDSVIADIRDQSKLEKEILDFQPDFIFHLAAQPLVRHSYEFPVDTFMVNAIGTANLLQAVTKLKKKCSVVIITTDKVYENNEKDYAYSETDKLAGYDPYSASKACAEIVTQSYRLSFFNPNDFDKHGKSIASVRAGNVIGGGDYAKDRIIPDIIRALQKNEPVKIRNPRSVRPWQHVLDPLSGYLLLGAKMTADPVKYSTAYNFGPDAEETMTVEEVVKTAISSFGKGNYEAESTQNNVHEAGLLKLNSSKANEELGWWPVYNAREAIERTMEWYRGNLDSKMSMAELCLNDIRNYESIMKEEWQK